MKFIKLFMLTLLLGNQFLALSHAQTNQPTQLNQNSYQGTGFPLVKIADLANLPDDQMVIVHVTIKAHIRKDDYLVVDETGEIRADIDYKLWRNLGITQPLLGQKLELVAKYENEPFDFDAPELDVKSITVIPNVANLNPATQSPNPTFPMNKIVDFKGFKDNQQTTIRATVVKYITDDIYIISDETGEIHADIDYKLWGRIGVTQPIMNQPLELFGEYDKEVFNFKKSEFKVKAIKIIR